MLNSSFKELGQVHLPYHGRQHYMHTFDLANPVMKTGYEDYLVPVTLLCQQAGATKGLAHMTVDEKVVRQGMSQRRPKPHVDGVFIPDRLHRNGKTMGDWGGGGGGGWNHSCNCIGEGNVRRMAVIVASNAVGCRAWNGVYDGEPKEDGDLSHLELDEGEILQPNKGYLLSPDCIHESLIQTKPVQRTFLRIALPLEIQ